MMYDIERQQWMHWPKTLIMRRDDGKTRRYIPEPECETDETGFVTRLRLGGFWYAQEERTCRDMAYSPIAFVCSRCGCIVRVLDVDGKLTVPKYCPSCGARVEEE